MEKNKYIFFEMNRCARLIKRHIDNDSQTACKNVERLTGAHGWMIGFLYHNRSRNIFQRDLEKECNIRRSSATQMLQRMEKNGMIRREGVDFDARLKRIVLTDRAVQLQEQIESRFAELEEQLKEGISEEELQTFFTVLSKIRKNIGEEENND